MIQVTHSPFLQALGFALINSLWQFALLWLVYVAINTACKITSHQKYSLGLVLQLAGFTSFIGTIAFYYRQYALSAQNVFTIPSGLLAGLSNDPGTTGYDKFLSWITHSKQFLPYLSVIYILLLVFLALKWVRAYRQAQFVRTKGLQKIDVTWRLFVQRLSMQLGIKNKVTIYLSEIVKTPLTVGFLKPVILIPLAGVNHLSIEQMEAVILHELAHIKRFDYLFNLFLALIEVTLFFNPFMHLIGRHIKNERENCCDDWVLQYEYNAASYAKALLQIAAFQFSTPLLALKAAEDKNVLLIRIKRMIEKNERSFFHYRHQLIALVVICTVLSSLALLAPADKIINTNASSVNFSTPKASRFSSAGDNSLQAAAFQIGKNNVASGTTTVSQKEEISLTINNNKVNPAPIQKDIQANNALSFLLTERVSEVQESRESKKYNNREDEQQAMDVMINAETENGLTKLADLFAVNISLDKREQAKNELKAVLKQLKELKIKIAVPGFEAVFPLDGDSPADDIDEKFSEENPSKPPVILSIKQAKALAIKLKSTIEKITNQQNILLTNTENTDFNFQLPNITFPASPGSFSYNFSAKPPVKPNAEKRSTPKAKRKNKAIIVTNDDELFDVDVPQPPDAMQAEPPARVNVRIIKI